VELDQLSTHACLPVMHFGVVRTAQYVRVGAKMGSCKLHSSCETNCLPIASSSVGHIVAVAHQLQGSQAALPW
jgi:hypothetical protein